MSKKKTTHIYVSGEVQAVGFRYWTHRVATGAGVSGWVKNLPDGRVEAVFAGDEEAVRRMVEWCREGPSSAVVSDVEVDESAEIGHDFDGFEVR